MKKKVLIIYTGGTIGMERSERGYVPVSGFRQLLHAQLKTEAAKQLPDFQIKEFEKLIDSANLQPDDWTRIGRLIGENWSDYDGFILLHGTDTLAYTASALSFMFQGIDKPIILTGSQIPLAELRNDALENLLTALIIEDQYDVPGVSVYFNGRLLRGNRCVKMKCNSFDAFDSPNYPWLGKVGINIDIDKTLLPTNDEFQMRIPEFIADAVVVLPVYPGMSARIFAALADDPAVQGLILQSYGVGNAPDNDPLFLTALQKAIERGVAILNITQCPYGAVDQRAYATGDTFSRLGVIAGSDLTLEAAFTKMHFLLACGFKGMELCEKLSQPMCGECE